MVQPASNRLLVESQRGAVNGIASLGADGKIPDAQTPTNAIKRGEIVIRPEDHGAVGNGVADDTVAVRAAFTAANALARAGIVAGIQHPGATVLLTGTYNLASLAAPIDVKCNIADSRATFVAPAAYAGVVVRVGHLDSGGYFQSATIRLPDVVKATGSAIVAGSVGVRVQNLGNSTLAFGRTYYFETGIHLTGHNQGTVYNQINTGHISYCKVALKLKPDLAGGWVNQNTFIGGGIQQSPGYAGGSRVAGWRHLVMDGNGINNVNMNTFVGTSFEGDASEYAFEIRQASNNVFQSTRHEQGTLGTAVTVAGAVLTKTAHGLAVGDMVTFAAGTVPGGMFLAAPYYVTETPTADTFGVSLKKGGTSVTFSSAGATVTYFRPQRIYIDTTGGAASNNVFRDPFAVQGVLELMNPVAAGTGNTIQTPDVLTSDNYLTSDLPPYRGRNRYSAATTRPIFAAYPATVNPIENPNGWTAALADRGIVFAAAEAETGRLSSSAGILNYKRPADTVAFELASVRRSPALTNITSLSCAANTTTTTTITLTDAAVNDHVLVTMLGHVAGLALSHAYVSAANTITVVFANLTASPISLTTSLQAMITRRYY